MLNICKQKTTLVTYIETPTVHNLIMMCKINTHEHAAAAAATSTDAFVGVIFMIVSVHVFYLDSTRW